VKANNPGLDGERYQTIYAKERGAIAAPPRAYISLRECFRKLKRKAPAWRKSPARGYGTFERSVPEVISEHRVAPECFQLRSAAQAMNRARAAGGRIIAIGRPRPRA